MIGEKSVFLQIRTRFAPTYIGGTLRPLRLARHLAVSLFLWCSGSNAQSPSRVRNVDEGVDGRNKREKSCPDKGSLIPKSSSRVGDGGEGVAGRNGWEKLLPVVIALQANQWLLTKSKQKIFELVARLDPSLLLKPKHQDDFSQRTIIQS